MIDDALLKVLFATDVWSTRQLLAECRALSPAAFAQDLGVGRQSLRDTLTHLVDAMLFYVDRLERRPRLLNLGRDGRDHDLLALTDLFERAARELEAAVATVVARHKLDDVLNWTETDEGEIAPSDQVTYAVALAQIVDHGIHHRTQAMEMLRLLGVERPMDWHPFDWDEAVRFRG